MICTACLVDYPVNDFAYISMYDGGLAGMEVLQTTSDIKHELQDSFDRWTGDVALHCQLHDSFTWSTSSRCSRTNHRSRIAR